MENTDIEKFWSLYDQYAKDGNHELRGELSTLLAKIENKSRQNQLFRPGKNWSKIIAWQVLRYQEFYTERNHRFELFAGEILAWTPHWDRDVFLTRFAKPEVVSGSILRPGYSLTHEDRGEKNDAEWEMFIKDKPFVDERGLYLPIYEPETLMILCDNEFATMRNLVIEYLAKEKGIVM